MKINRKQLREMIKEAVHKEVYDLAAGQKKLSKRIQSYVTRAPLKEYKEITSKKALLEFVGPFKKLSVKDLEKEADEKQIKHLFRLAKEVEKSRKELGGIKITNLNALDQALSNYVDNLINLWTGIKTSEITDSTKGKLSKPFAAAFYTLKSLSEILSDAANELLASVPKSTGVYAAGKEQDEIEDTLASTMKSPKQMAKDVLDFGAGMGTGRGGR